MVGFPSTCHQFETDGVPITQTPALTHAFRLVRLVARYSLMDFGAFQKARTHAFEIEERGSILKHRNGFESSESKQDVVRKNRSYTLGFCVH